MLSARFPRELASSIRSLAFRDHVTVSEWLRRTARREVSELVDVDITANYPWSGGTHVRIPAKLLRDATEAQMRERAYTVRTLRCQHFSAANVVALTCSLCGDAA